MKSTKKGIIKRTALIATIVLFMTGCGSNKAIEVDISMTEHNGYIDLILEDLGLDFDLVTMGANCYTGVQKNSFTTERYGILYTEFRYCSANETTIFRVYNSETDQKLREPEQGELYSYDRYGFHIGSSNANEL